MTQNAKLLAYLEVHDGVTIFEAMFDLGIGCLHKRLSEIEPQLAGMGYVLQDDWETTPGGKRVIRHRLSKIAYG